jgi:uncharacterized protein (TIGR02145 family)
MLKFVCMILLVFSSAGLLAQNVRMIFSWTGALAENGSVTVRAVNLTTNDTLLFPGRDTLILTTDTPIHSDPEYFPAFSLFPNPSDGAASARISLDRNQQVVLRVLSMDGHLISEFVQRLQPGIHDLDINLGHVGIFVLTIKTEDWYFSERIINLRAGEKYNQIRYRGIAGSPNIETGPSLLKTMKTKQYLKFNWGDIVLYRFEGVDTISGIKYITVLADAPTSNGDRRKEIDFVDCRDGDGRQYPVVKIGNKFWMAENLAYLPSVYPSNDRSGTAYRYYIYDYQGENTNQAKGLYNFSTYGVLYNWGAATKACPAGWHLPAEPEWETLALLLAENPFENNFQAAGGKLKATGINYWSSPNIGATNEVGFTGMPGGSLGSYGAFQTIHEYAWFWTATQENNDEAWYYEMMNLTGSLERWTNDKAAGFSVRCIK